MLTPAIKIAKRLGLGRAFYRLKALNKSDSVFLWIPKTGGTSIRGLLAQYGMNTFKELPAVRHYFPNRGMVTFGHMDYARLVTDGYVSRAYDASAYKFYFTRNPYSRAVSLFFYCKKLRLLDSATSFLEFSKKLTDTDIPDIGLYNVQGLSQCNPQYRWIKDVAVSFGGRLEDIDRDMKVVLTELGVPTSCAVEVMNETEHDQYRSYYCSVSKKRIEEYYARDFELFNYAIEDWS